MNRFTTYARIGVFILFLLLPVIVMTLGIDPEVRLVEKRKLAPAPRMRINRKFAKTVDRYLEDHFGGRRLLAKAALYFDRHIAGKPVIESVLLGEHGWLYYGTRQILKKYMGADRLSSDQIENIARTVIEQYRFCQAHGIRYMLVVPPDKNTIYPEHLPEWIRGSRVATPLTQFMDYMRFQKNISMIDMRDNLVQVKSNKLLYWKTDTHWTQWGAFFGYRQIADQLSKWFPAKPSMEITDFKIKIGTRKGGDLAAMIGKRQKIREGYPVFTPKNGWQAKRLTPESFYLAKYSLRGKKDNRLIIMESSNNQLPKAVVFRDSFAENLTSFLAEHFQRVVFHWHFLHSYHFDETLILREKPDVVIFEVAERSLHYILSMGNSPTLKQWSYKGH